MLVQVYQYTGQVTRSVARGSLVAEVEVDEYPDDQVAFAHEHGGDFLEFVHEPAHA